ncbi:galactoside O-acetyltransferase, partial [Escherichia coli MS 79-10]
LLFPFTGHPVHHELRKNGEMYSFPITIGSAAEGDDEIAPEVDVDDEPEEE